MIMMSLLLFFALTLFSAKAAYAEQDTYRAAVLEYYPAQNRSAPFEIFQKNINALTGFIQEAAAQGAHIVVFPEDGLAGIDIDPKHLDILSTEIPDLKEITPPCTTYNVNFSQVIREFSCAAQRHKIYVVVNLMEKEIDTVKNKSIYYNTLLVFNTNGEIVTKYRKMHLFMVKFLEPGNELVTFSTDFGVTFGIFICYDIFFKKPAIDILSNQNVTDIITVQAWPAHLPFYSSLSVQHGYAKSNGVNLLVSGLNLPKEKMSGSGIYFADGRVAETYFSDKPAAKLLIQDVPKISSRIPNSSCTLQKPSLPYQPMAESPIANCTIADDLSDYTFKSLNLLQKQMVVETICSGSSSFCCTFNISVNRIRNVQPTYFYKLAAFQGNGQTQENETIGQRICGIVACLSEDSKTCGARKAVTSTGVTFEKISIKTTVDGTDARYFPITLTSDLQLTANYTFCSIKNGNKIDITMSTTEPHATLFTFGVSGRVFKYDGLPAGPNNDASTVKSNMLILVLLFSFYTFYSS